MRKSNLDGRMNELFLTIKLMRTGTKNYSDACDQLKHQLKSRHWNFAFIAICKKMLTVATKQFDVYPWEKILFKSVKRDFAVEKVL